VEQWNDRPQRVLREELAAAHDDEDEPGGIRHGNRKALHRLRLGKDVRREGGGEKAKSDDEAGRDRGPEE